MLRDANASAPTSVMRGDGGGRRRQLGRVRVGSDCVGIGEGRMKAMAAPRTTAARHVRLQNNNAMKENNTTTCLFGVNMLVLSLVAAATNDCSRY